MNFYDSPAVTLKACIKGHSAEPIENLYVKLTRQTDTDLVKIELVTGALAQPIMVSSKALFTAVNTITQITTAP